MVCCWRSSFHFSFFLRVEVRDVPFRTQGDVDSNLDDFETLYPSHPFDRNNQYYDASKLNSAVPSDLNGSLSVIHLNIRSLKANGEDFIAYLATLRVTFDVICLSETWQVNPTVDSLFPDYVGYHAQRPAGQRGGGVAIYVHKKYASSLITELTVMTDYNECIFANICSRNKNIIVGTCYRPPSSNVSHFLDSLSLIVSNLNPNRSDIILSGDFNLDMLNMHVLRDSFDFYNAMNTYSLTPVIFKPSRIKNNSYSLIYNIYI